MENPTSSPGGWSPKTISPSEKRGHTYLGNTTEAFFQHSSAERINTNAKIADALGKQYPMLECVITTSFSCDLIGFAASGAASFTFIKENEDSHGVREPSSLSVTKYVPPARRTGNGVVIEGLSFAKMLYKWNDDEFIVYLSEGDHGPYPSGKNFYILTHGKWKANALVRAAGIWTNELHDEIWVFDQGFWQKSAALYDSIRNASFDDVILNPELKKAIIDDHMSFFNGKETYANLKVPWKRGIICYGPPGNGKTISIKAMMHQLYSLKDPVPTLYVQSLASYGGPEYAVKQIFALARQMAPCYLILEDLDTIITENVRSYFLNEVDGLKSNDGIFILGSTNHLDRLDPGISKRPSRFDRKYLFPDPNKEERITYCHYWQRKLEDNKDIAFPDELCGAVSGITDGFSFAYMQEAFIAALLAIARETEEKSLDDEYELEDMGHDWVGALATSDGNLDECILWIEIKKQVKILREEMDKEKDAGRTIESVF